MPQDHLHERHTADTDQNEATESLKNVVLVMHSSQLLVPPPPPSPASNTPAVAKSPKTAQPPQVGPADTAGSAPASAAPPADARTAEQRELWDASARRVERILPGFLGEVVGAGQR